MPLSSWPLSVSERVGLPLGQALYGSFLGLLAYLKVAVVIGSLLFLFSAVFTNNAFLKGVAVMGIAEGLLAVTEAIFRHQIDLPGIFGNLFAMVGNLNAETMDTVRDEQCHGRSPFCMGTAFCCCLFPVRHLYFTDTGRKIATDPFYTPLS
ncbi:MAG: hypothetical protein U5N26_01550 [Candidatus Marinimicrobia bacterium]|nr:hypothetical protein [Candidatus Neomarinimicrobiota bacterium]